MASEHEEQQQSFNWAKTALLVIDMQNDFLNPESPMFVAGGPSIIPAVKESVEFARDKGAFIVWVVREHDEHGRDVELFRRHLYGKGKANPTAKGSNGAEIVKDLIPQEGDYKLIKTRFSAFFDTHLHNVLKSLDIASVAVVGVQTPNCIRQTVFDSVALNYSPVIVLSNATAAANSEVHAANLFDMQNVGVMVTTLPAWQGKTLNHVLAFY